MELVKKRIADDLSFNPYTTRPTDAPDRLYAAARAGRFLAKDLLKLSQEPELLIKECERYLYDHLRNTADGRVPQPEAWQQLYRAAFWFSCLNVFQEFVELEHHVRALETHTGVRLQQALTQTLLEVGAANREWIWNRFRRMTDVCARWRGHVAGATAVARAANCLQAICGHVALPIIDLDLLYKIDLVAELTADPQLLLCVQVKYSKEILPRIEILDLDRAPGPHAWFGEHERTAIGMANFNKNHFVNWIPMLVRVGTERLPIRDIEPLPLLHAALKETLQSL